MITPGVSSVLACNVPVFRYALERWLPDNYVLTVPETPTNLLEALRTAPLNLEVAAGPVTNAILYLPQSDTNMPPLWTGAFTADNIRSLVDSPARRAIVRHIQHGASVVWVLLESGDAKADAATARILESELARQTQQLRMPEVDPDDPRTADNAHLKIAFPTVRVTPNDPAEQLLTAMVSGSDTNLPAVVPVFGRGRALGRFSGKELTAATIGDAAVFLCGACSCEIKVQNPGWDLLIAVDWDALIDNPVVKDPELPPLISLSETVATPRPAPGPPVSTPVSGGSLPRHLLIVISILVLVVVAGTAIVRRKP